MVLNMKGGRNVGGMVLGIVFAIVTLQVLVEILPDFITAIINLSTISNLSFSGFFAGGGVVLLLLSVAILIGIFKLIGVGGGSR